MFTLGPEEMFKRKPEQGSAVTGIGPKPGSVLLIRRLPVAELACWPSAREPITIATMDAPRIFCDDIVFGIS